MAASGSHRGGLPAFTQTERGRQKAWATCGRHGNQNGSIADTRAIMNITTEQLFDNARTQNGFKPEPISEATLHRLYDMLKWAPTSANCSPARFVFVTTPAAKATLLAAMSPNNVEKTRQAPVSVIIGMDMAFYEQLPKLFPHADAKAWFVGNQPMIEATAMRNSSLQGAYLIMAARALGLDCGPMSGFDAAKVDAAFWGGSSVKTNFIVNLGHGEPSKVMPRLPRLSFDEACRIA
jgi:3-hydroxypropanoate dehydrogenase